MEKKSKQKPLRLPGQTIDEKIGTILDEKIMSYLLSIILVLFLVAYEWIHWFWVIQPRPILVTIIGVIFTIFCISRIRINISDIQNLKKGRDGERIVGQMLEELRSDGAVVFHDILGPSFNIDHVVVSPHGIFTIETKTWNKKSKDEVIKFDGERLFINGYSPERDPIKQSLAGAHWIKQTLKESTGKEFHIKPVIVFPDWF